MSLMENNVELAVFGGGCFWCLEAPFQRVRGVYKVESGYAGGAMPDPTYEAVCTGTTGHAEIVSIEFNPAEISYTELLELFFALHDPTTLNRQGADVGSQYRSVIFPQSEGQRQQAEEFIRKLDESGAWSTPVVTTIEEADTIYPAEGYHQDYFKNNPGNPYCQMVVAPKLQKFLAQQAGSLKPG